MATATGKLCRVCQKDVTNAKRVKDAKGQYYCTDCHGKLVKKPAVGVEKGAVEKAAKAKGAKPAKAAAAQAGELDLAPVREAVAMEVKPQEKKRPAAASKGDELDLAPVREAGAMETKPAEKKKPAAASKGDDLDLAPVIEAPKPAKPQVQVIVEEADEEKPAGSGAKVLKVLIVLVVLGVLGAAGWYVKGAFFS